MTGETAAYVGFAYAGVGALLFFYFQMREDQRGDVALGCLGGLMMSFVPLLVMFLIFWPIWAPLFWWLESRSNDREGG